MAWTRTVIYCRKCGEKSLWYNPSRGKFECLNPRCAWEETIQGVASTPHFQEEPKSGHEASSESPRKGMTVQCKKCGKKSLWFNPSVDKYQCLNHKCRWECTIAEYAVTPEFVERKPKPPVSHEFDIPVWIVQTLEGRAFWTGVAVISIILWFILWVYFRYDDVISRTIAIGIPIAILVIIKFLLKKFVRQYAVIAASLRHDGTKGKTSNWRRRLVGSSWLRLLVVITIIAGLVVIPWTGYGLFTHQIDPVMGTITFIFEFALFVWLIRLLNSSRQMSKKPGFRLVFFSLLGIALVCAFAGIEPLATYKNISSSYISEQWARAAHKTETSRPTPETVAAAIANARPAVVYIQTETIKGSYGQGTGMIVHKSGYILTSNHVVKDSRLPTITLETGRQYSGSIVKRDDFRDLAIIKIATNGVDLPTVNLGNSDKLEIGDEVIAIGYSLGLKGSASNTRGIVSALREYDGVHYLQTDAAVNPGNSGGPLINLKGEVVGVIVAKIVRESVEGIGFAVAINDVKPFIYGQSQGEQTPHQEEKAQTPEQTLLALEKDTFMWINSERLTRGMPSVIWNEVIHSGARRHSESMQQKGYLYHETFGQFAECCYGASYASPSHGSAKATVDAWLSSTAGHREILLDRRYKQGAVGIAKDKGFWATYRCQ